jgi:hypothetical protein
MQKSSAVAQNDYGRFAPAFQTIKSKRFPQEPASLRLERDGFSSNRHPALPFCLSMIFSENRSPLFRIML